MSDEKIIALIKAGKVEKAFVRMYRYLPKIEKYICANSGTKDEARDIFQEAMVLLYNKVLNGEWNPETKAEGFMFLTCKNLWSNELRKKKVRRDNSGNIQMDNEDGVAEKEEKEVQLKIVEKVFDEIAAKCKSILTLFYFESLSMEQIAKRFGYKSVKSAKVQKYKCMENVRRLVMEKQQLSNH